MSDVLFESSLEWLVENCERVDVAVAGRSYVMLGDSQAYGRSSAMGPLVTLERRGDMQVAADHIAGRTFADQGDTATREAVIRSEVKRWVADL